MDMADVVPQCGTGARMQQRAGLHQVFLWEWKTVFVHMGIVQKALPSPYDSLLFCSLIFERECAVLRNVGH